MRVPSRRTVASFFVGNWLWTYLVGPAIALVPTGAVWRVGVTNPFWLVAVFLGFLGVVLVYVEPRVQEWWRWRNRDLKVEIEEEEWDFIPGVARFLEIRVRVTNQTNTPKRFRGFPLTVWNDDPAAQVHDAARAGQAQYSRQQRRQSLKSFSVVEPGTSVVGWMVYTLGWSARAGKPDFDFGVDDEHGETFWARGLGSNYVRTPTLTESPTSETKVSLDTRSPAVTGTPGPELQITNAEWSAFKRSESES